MMQNVNTVLVGNATQKTSYAGTETVAGLGAGEIFMEDQNGVIINATGDVTAATAVRFGLKTGNTLTYTDLSGNEASVNEIKYSAFIKKGSIKKVTKQEYTAPAEDSILFDFTGVTPVVGNRYVVRFIYRDLYEHPGQFTKTYEVIATTNVLADLVAALKNRINKDMGRRITISSGDSYATNFTATAKVKNDNEGKESINIYTQVSMTAVAYYTNPSATGFASKVKYPIASLDISKTTGNPGKGFWKQVRDVEQAALAYKGITYRTSWPYSLLKPTLKVDETLTYDSMIIEFENTYLTPDNQLNSHTKQTVEIYTKAAGTANAIEGFVTSFIG